MLPGPRSLKPFTLSLISIGRWHRGRAEEWLAPLGLHVGQELVLLNLLDHDGQSLTELAIGHPVSAATLTKMTDRLVAGGFLRKVADRVDQRMVRVFLTQQTRALESKLRGMGPTLEAEVLSGLSAEDQEQLVRILGAVATSLPSKIC
jgi:DNA-binding MarR family transcriptional regulator